MAESTATERVIQLPSYIKVLVAQAPREGTGKNGKPYKFQEIDCVTLNEHGEAIQVGVMPVPNQQIGLISEGIYTPVYGMRVDFQTRKISPSIISLNRHEERQRQAPASTKAA